jgi:plasmid maintenance system killer protein
MIDELKIRKREFELKKLQYQSDSLNSLSTMIGEHYAVLQTNLNIAYSLRTNPNNNHLLVSYNADEFIHERINNLNK